MRGIRGATIVEKDHPDEIFSKTRELLLSIQKQNPDLFPESICSIFFTVTNDICSAFPARAARALGWDQVPLMCASEIPVENSLPRCIRVLILWNTQKPQHDIQHVYLHQARTLRSDLIVDQTEQSKEKLS